MKCPVCQLEMIPIRDGNTLGRLPGRPELDLKELIGYNCPTQNDLPYGSKTPHCTIRGLNTTITLYPYRLSIWDSSPDMNVGKQGVTLYHFKPDDPSILGSGRFTEVCSLPKIKLGDEEYLKRKLGIYVLFS
jgi:hypothetical protein